MQTKECADCRNVKEAPEFYQDKSRSDGLSRMCRVCTLLERARYRAANRKKLRDDARTDRAAHPERGIWRVMIKRCTDPHQMHYRYYGGRGIRVCDRWLNSFESFLADMGARPGPEYSIDRHPDKDGNYEPGNCRWATDIEQARNTRGNRIVHAFGRKQCVAAWAEEASLPYGVLKDRLALGWDPERAITTPAQKQRKGIEINGTLKSIRQWSRESGTSYGTILGRLDAGWSPERAVFSPSQKGIPLAGFRRNAA